MRAIMIVLTMLCAASLNAYEIEGNPDRKISFGLNYDRVGSSAEYKFGTIKISDFTKTTGNQFIADIKIPVSPFFTFQVRGGYLGSSVSTFVNETLDSSGYDLGFGLRFYIP